MKTGHLKVLDLKVAAVMVGKFEHFRRMVQKLLSRHKKRKSWSVLK
jgi:hypothetical protein